MNNLQNLFQDFLKSYDPESKDALWQEQSKIFHDFWNKSIMPDSPDDLNDQDTDTIIRILDKNGRGNTRESEAVAKAMIAQGAWRRMFNGIKNKPELKNQLDKIFKTNGDEKAKLIDELYELNAGNRNNLTGPSGNAVCAMIFAYDPLNHISIISLNDRRKLFDWIGFNTEVDFDKDSIGTKIVKSNQDLLEGFKQIGINYSPRTISTFLYSAEIRPLWKMETENDPAPWGGYKHLPSSSDSEVSDPSLFYMESQLEDFIIENWDRTEFGSKYDLIEENGELVSQQYKTGIGRIDILAKDKKTDQLVVIELKKNQTSDDTVGQLARYMGWLEDNKTGGKPTKGIIIAAQYDERLYYALKKLNDSEVYLYQVDFKLKEFKK